MSSPEDLIEKIKALPPEGQDEVEDFVDFIATRVTDRSLVRATGRASTASFAAVWDNPEDDIYDAA